MTCVPRGAQTDGVLFWVIGVKELQAVVCRWKDVKIQSVRF